MPLQQKTQWRHSEAVEKEQKRSGFSTTNKPFNDNTSTDHPRSNGLLLILERKKAL